MLLQRKLRFGASLLSVGCVLAAIGEIVNIFSLDVFSSTWRTSLWLIIGGTFLLLVGLSSFASASEEINGTGYVGTILLQIGGIFSLIGIVALDLIVLPFLLHLAATIASTINTPVIATQNEINSIINALNNLGGSTIQKLFPGVLPHLTPAHFQLVNGILLVNQGLAQEHLPSIETLTLWGRISLTGGLLVPGYLLLGFALRNNPGQTAIRGYLLIILALLNLLCQYFVTLPPYLGNITAALLFLTLAWLGISAWFPTSEEVVEVEVIEKRTRRLEV